MKTLIFYSEEYELTVLKWTIGVLASPFQNYFKYEYTNIYIINS